MLCHYNDTIISDVNINIIYNGESNLLLYSNLSMSYAEIKEIICYRIGWNYNNIDVEITLRCQIGEYQYYLLPIVCDDNFKTTIDSFIQNDLKIITLYASSRSKFMFVPTFASILKSFSRGKNNLLLNDLLQKINNTMFDNLFVDQHRFNYSKSSDNENDDTLYLNMTLNVDGEIILSIPKFENASWSSFGVSHYWVFSHKYISGGSHFEIG